LHLSTAGDRAAIFAVKICRVSCRPAKTAVAKKSVFPLLPRGVIHDPDPVSITLIVFQPVLSNLRA
jgi:hypothetical protein